MPLTPATTDKFLKVGLPGTATTLSAPGYTSGNNSVNIGSTSNWSTDTPIVFAMDTVTVTNGVAVRNPGSYCEFFGIVSSATAVGNLALLFGTPQNYVAGTLTRVYIPVAGTRENMIIDGLRQDHNGKGNHQSLTDDNNNIWLGRISVASAVNYLAIANSIAGSAPSIQATGSDTNIDVQIIPKGTGVVKVDGSAPRQFFAQFNFIESGCIWTATAPGSTLVASMTAGVVWINGKRLTVAAVASRTFVASVDTYVDFQDNNDGTAKVVYTTVTNNVTSPAIPNSLTDQTNVRNAIVCSGATNIPAQTAINQGQIESLVPTISTIALSVSDALGLVINPRDPQRKTLSTRMLGTNFNTTTTFAAVTGQAVDFVAPANCYRVKIESFADYMTTNAANTGCNVRFYSNSIGGTSLNESASNTSAANTPTPCQCKMYMTVVPGTLYRVILGANVNSGAGLIAAGAAQPAFITAERA